MAVSQIASDNEAGGKTAADALAKLIGGSGKVFVVNVKPGISTTDLREKGFVAGAKAAGLTYVGREYSNDKAEVAAAKTKAALTTIGDAGMMKDWKMTTKDGTTIFGMPKVALVRSIVLNHTYHHRGQLSVYLRLLDVPVPSIYGPSADENPMAAAQA
jgi:hypothetical protein